MGEKEGGARQERKTPWRLLAHQTGSKVCGPRLRDQDFGNAHHPLWSQENEGAGCFA